MINKPIGIQSLENFEQLLSSFEALTKEQKDKILKEEFGSLKKELT